MNYKYTSACTISSSFENSVAAKPTPKTSLPVSPVFSFKSANTPKINTLINKILY